MSGGSSPAFGSEIQRGIDTAAGAVSTTVLTLASGVALNERAILILNWYSASITVSSVVDSRGNTWAKDKEALALSSPSANLSIWSANAGAALLTSDTITITWSSSATTYRAWALLRATGVATSSAVDQTAQGTATSATVTVSASTTAANTLLIGNVLIESQARTLDATDWTIDGAAHDWAAGSFRGYYLYHPETAAGSKNPNGTLSASFTWGCIWVAYK